MTMSLRDRRRQATALEIQQAALTVALRMGYAAATTDAIAAEAGISPRTFFNYYCNKQAAILGQPPVLDAARGQWIVTSQAALIDDIVRLLGQIVTQDRLDRSRLRLLIAVVDETPDLQVLFRKSMDDMSATLAGLLVERLGSDRRFEAGLLAGLATHALSNAVMTWAAHDAMPETQIAPMTRAQLAGVADLLGGAGSEAQARLA